MNRVILGSKHVGETIKQVFDFTSRLVLGETLSSAATVAAVYSGDSSATLTVGSSSISGAKVTVGLAAGSLGVVYLVTCTAVTSAAQTLELVGLLAIVPEAM